MKITFRTHNQPTPLLVHIELMDSDWLRKSGDKILLEQVFEFRIGYVTIDN